jgi:hypothetical protein
MTIETELAALTTAVSNLTDAVNVKKEVLDDAVDDAEAAQAAAESAQSAAEAAAAFAQAAAPLASIGYVIDNAGEALITGRIGNGVRVPFSCTITSVTLLADVVGSVVIDIWKDSFANFPPTVEDSICAAAKPTLSSAQTLFDETLTGWSKTIAAGDVLFFNVDSAATITNLTIILGVTKT